MQQQLRLVIPSSLVGKHTLCVGGFGGEAPAAKRQSPRFAG